MTRTMFQKNRRAFRALLIVTLLTGFAVSGCSKPAAIFPASLSAPRAIAVARGEVCIPPVDAKLGSIGNGPLVACGSEQTSAIGLIVNEQTNDVAVTNLGGRSPQLINLEPSIPGISHIPVGKHPVDIAVGRDGTVAYVVNQLDRSLSPINLWLLRSMDAVSLPGVPRSVDIAGGADGSKEQIVVALTGPSALWIRDAITCGEPTGVADRRGGKADQGCGDLAAAAPVTLALANTVASVTIAPGGDVAYVVYSDSNDLSMIALNANALADTTCGDGKTSAPCELKRIALADASEPVWGYSAVESDPLGKFVYVVDRANSQVLFIDAENGELVDAAVSVEPPALPFTTLRGASVGRSPVSVIGDVSRNVIAETQGRAIVRYSFGAFVASDNGKITYVEAYNAECSFETGGKLLTSADFYENPSMRKQSVEQNCLTAPAFPLLSPGATSSAALEHRVFENNGVRLVINPTFAPRDARSAVGRVAPRGTCSLPDALIETAREKIGGQALSCGAPVLPQPTSLAAGPVNPADFGAVPRASLMELQSVIMTADNGSIDTEVRATPYDYRLRDETWTVTYEGILPATVQIDRGVVDRDVDGLFQGGGIDLCASGVQIGDRLTIVGRPLVDGKVPNNCEEFDSEDKTQLDYLTYEIVDLTAATMQLAVIDDAAALGFVATLPSRNCAAFNRGLRYTVRPVDEWIVVGERSGLVSSFENQADECVAREGSEFGRTNARVKTGDSYLGPYLSFRLYEGDVEPVRDMSYTFQVERNFAAEQYETGSANPVQTLLVRNIGIGDFLITTDPTANFVYLKNLMKPLEDSKILR